jgi:hypothetical protein
MLRTIKALIFGMALILAGSATAHATSGVWDITGGTDVNDGTNYVLGWSFTPKSNMEVAALGVYAAPDFLTGQRVFTQTHDVGLFDALGQRLASVTVSNSDGLYGMFRVHNLDTVQQLTGGNLYYLAAAMGADQFIYNPDSFVPSKLINFGQFLYAAGNDITQYLPYDTSGDRYFGPNFDTSPVPEPSTLLLVGAGLGGAVLLRKRARN